MRRQYNRYYGRYKADYGAAQHISQRDSVSRTLGGIDKDIERILLSLPPVQLESVFMRYREKHGESALSYARKTYVKWKSGTVKMGGAIAERLTNLVPHVIEPHARFELVKKLRSVHLHRQHKHVTCSPSEWRSHVAAVLAELLAASHKFQLPQHVLDRVHWLTEGDAVAAQRLLAAAEQDEAAVRLQYLEADFKRIDLLLQHVKATKSMRHTIELPQGTVTVVIELPRKSLWSRLAEILS